MKRCRDCGEVKPLAAFYQNRNMTDGYLSRCKPCAIQRYAVGRSERAKRDRLYFQTIKVERGCVDCGYREHPAALDFDHREGETKAYQIGAMAGMSRLLIDAEIAKCDVRCANCHRIYTFERGQLGQFGSKKPSHGNRKQITS